MAPNSNPRIQRSQLGEVTRLGVGGQGTVYAAPALRMQYASALVYKEYKPQAISSLDISVLESMPSYLETLQVSEGLELLSMSAWPCRLVEEAGTVRGFVMPAIPSEFFLDIKKASGVQRSAGEFQHLLNSDDFLARRHIQLTDRHRFALLADVARSLAVFHRHGVAVGDLSPKNLLFALDPHARVFFIDCDAMRFRGRSVMPQLETPGWEVHALNPNEELGTEASDSYKLALLVLRLFAGDQSTRDPARLPSSIPSPVRRIITDGLSTSPSARPRPRMWIEPLMSAAAAAATIPPVMNQSAITPPSTSPRTQGSTSQTAHRPPPSVAKSFKASNRSGPLVPSPRGSVRSRSRRGVAWLLVAGALVAVVAVAVVAGSGGDNTGNSSAVSPTAVLSNVAQTGSASLRMQQGVGKVDLTGVVQDGTSVTLAIEATGPGVPRPASSCIVVHGIAVPPRSQSLSVEAPDHYVGTLTFSLLEGGSGDYYYLYGCDGERADQLQLFTVTGVPEPPDGPTPTRTIQ